MWSACIVQAAAKIPGLLTCIIRVRALAGVVEQGKDVMGAAETGSGKTLAYGLPILDFLLKQRDQQHKQLPSRAG